MTKQQLIKKLKALPKEGSKGNYEQGHIKADDLLIRYINDPEIADAFEEVARWYS